MLDVCDPVQLFYLLTHQLNKSTYMFYYCSFSPVTDLYL